MTETENREDIPGDDPLRELWVRLNKGEARLNLPPGILRGLMSDPDQLSIIKMAASIEAILGELIFLGFSRSNGGLGGRPNRELFKEASDYLVETLPFNGSRGSKLGLALALGEISKGDFDFIDSLAKLRNRYAHHIRNAASPVKELWLAEKATNRKFSARLFYGQEMRSKDPHPQHLKLMIVYTFAEFLARVEEKHQIRSIWFSELLGPPPEEEL